MTQAFSGSSPTVLAIALAGAIALGAGMISTPAQAGSVTTPATPTAHAAGLTDVDPLDSPLWDYLRGALFADETIVFNDRVVVRVPTAVEDGRYVPVSVEADGIEDAQAVLVFADLNPINRAVQFDLAHSRPYVALRMKVNEATPVRAAVRDSQGVWHVGGAWVDAPGGGCAAPSVTTTVADWEDHLGDVQAMVVRTGDGHDRLRLLINHPMDTGLVDNVPEFHLSDLTVMGRSSGQTVAQMTVWSAMSANPVLTLEVDPAHVDPDGYQLAIQDNEGNSFSAVLAAAQRSMPDPAGTAKTIANSTLGAW